MFAHIVRLEQSGSGGYQARYRLDSDSEPTYRSKLFSDSVLGGKKKARSAAEQFLLKVFGKKNAHLVLAGRTAGMKFVDDPRRVARINTSGRTGVYRGDHFVQRGETKQRIRYWAASYSIGRDGEKTNRSKRFYFGVERTEEEAKALAMRFRDRWERAYLKGGTDAIRRFFERSR